MAHLCGLCLTLRAEHGHAARPVTNYDGLLVSVLVEAQDPARSPHRTAGPCALRGLRAADVVTARAEGARLAAAVSLLLAAGKARDHIADRDGPFARRPVAAAAGRLADRWDVAGARTGAAVGFDPAVLRAAAGRQAALEATPGPALLELTEPAETAVAAAFAHTAVLAGKPHNAEPLAEAGRFFGRIAHLIDAVEDLADDAAAGAFNPLPATGTGPGAARRLCDDARHGLRLALADLDLADGTLVRALLDKQVGRTIHRTFAQYPPEPPQYPQQPPQYPQQPPQYPQQPPQYPQQPPPPYPPPPRRPDRAGPLLACLAGSAICCTCGVYQPEWSEHHGKGCGDRCWCGRNCDGCECPCDCCDCCCCDC